MADNVTAAEPTMLDLVKQTLRLTVTDYDVEVQALIDAALLDLGIAGIDQYSEGDALVLQAVKTYCLAHFGAPPNYDQLAASYDQQKGMLQIASGYTDWGDIT